MLRTDHNREAHTSRGSRASRGATRVLLVAGVALAALLLVGSVVLLVGGFDGGDGESPVDLPDGDVRQLPPGSPDGRTRVRQGAGDEESDPDDDEFLWDPRKNPRDPEGAVFHIDGASVMALLEAREWEAMRTQIQLLQAQGTEIPTEIVEALLALLEGEDTRIDATLALGQIKDAAAGQLLAMRATGTHHPIEVRLAALDALAASGNSAALSMIQALVEDPEVDSRLLRHAAPALAAMGGPEAGRTLTNLLTSLPDDHRARDALVSALGKAADSGQILATAMREARDAGDARATSSLVKVALLQRESADRALRDEVRRMLEDPTAFENIEQRDLVRLRTTVLSAAAAMGGDLIDPLLRMAENDTDGMGGAALYSLRHTRGDAAADKLLAAMERLPESRYALVTALSETRSKKATTALVGLLDSEDDNLRQAAARGLALGRDASAAKPILDRLDTAKPTPHVARQLIEALGKIGNRDALPRLKELMESDDETWKGLMPYVRVAIVRIETGDPDSRRMK